MKSIGCSCALALVTVCLLMTGCVPRRIAWSPDGAHAAVFAGDGLHLCGPDGTLSETILPGEGLAEWFPDSHRLAVVSEVGKQSWKDMQKVLPPEERQRVVQGATMILDEFKAGHSFSDAFMELSGLSDEEKNAVLVDLAESEGTKEDAGANWAALQQKEASLVQIRIGTLEEGKLTLGPPVLNTLRKILDIRVSPTATAIAYSAQVDPNHFLELLAVPTDGSEPPQLVETNTAFGFDWSADGHSLLYVHGLLESTVLGSLTRRGILNAAGKIDIQTNADDLANLLFDGYNKVRCLSNGRIIFAAMEIHLPCTEVEMPKKHQLFALDPERQAVIPLILGSVQDRLPDDLAFYEISPDGQQIAMSGNKGPVLVLNLATGALDTVQAAGIADAAFVPVWRSSGELCFNLDTNGQPSQVALWSNGTNRVLSATWPPEARKGFLGNFATNGQPAQAALWSNGTNRVLSTNWPPKAVKGFLEK